MLAGGSTSELSEGHTMSGLILFGIANLISRGNQCSWDKLFLLFSAIH